MRLLMLLFPNTLKFDKDFFLHSTLNPEIVKIKCMSNVKLYVIMSDKQRNIFWMRK